MSEVTKAREALRVARDNLEKALKSSNGAPTKNRCDHDMRPMYNHMSEAFSGARCSKCGYTEWA